jgi:hypothetical protein
MQTRNWSRGKRFESARRLSFLPAKPAKTKTSDQNIGDFVSSRLSRSLVPCIGVLQMVAGHSRWRRRILWYGPLDRRAGVSVDAAPSIKLRPSAEKKVDPRK